VAICLSGKKKSEATAFWPGCALNTLNGYIEAATFKHPLFSLNYKMKKEGVWGAWNIPTQGAAYVR